VQGGGWGGKCEEGRQRCKGEGGSMRKGGGDCEEGRGRGSKCEGGGSRDEHGLAKPTG
jgi:hypothetical protein